MTSCFQTFCCSVLLIFPAVCCLSGFSWSGLSFCEAALEPLAPLNRPHCSFHNNSRRTSGGSLQLSTALSGPAPIKDVLEGERSLWSRIICIKLSPQQGCRCFHVLIGSLLPCGRFLPLIIITQRQMENGRVKEYKTHRNELIEAASTPTGESSFTWVWLKICDLHVVWGQHGPAEVRPGHRFGVLGLDVYIDVFFKLLDEE